MDPAADPQRVDQLAATLRAQADDLSLYAGMLLNLVTGALPPELVEVEHERRRFGGLRRGEPAVTAVRVTLGEWRFALSRAAVGAPPVAELRHVIRGIVLSSEQLPLVPWSRRLAEELSRAVGRDAGASAAMERLLAPPGA